MAVNRHVVTSVVDLSPVFSKLSMSLDNKTLVKKTLKCQTYCMQNHCYFCQKNGRSSELQIRGDIEDNSKRIFFISELKHML